MDHQSRWRKHFEALQAFIAREGHSKVPAHHIEEHESGAIQLGNWVSHQRQTHKKGMLHPDRTSALTGLPGWQWTLSRGPQRDQHREIDILMLRQQGMTLQQIGDKLGVSRQRVHQLLKRAANAH